MIEQVDRVDDFHLRPGFLDFASDLKNTADITCRNNLSVRLSEERHLASSKTFGHFRLGKVVRAGGAAADLGFFERDEFKTRDHLKQGARLRANLLAVAEVTRVVIGNAERNGIFRRDRSERDEELGDVANFGDEALRQVAIGFVVEKMTIIFKHRAAAGGIDDDRIKVVGVEGGEILSRERQGGRFHAGVIMNRAAADLSARNEDFAAVMLQNACGGGVGFGLKRVGHAAEKQSDFGALGTDRRQGFGKVRAEPSQARQHRLKSAQGRRQKFRQSKFIKKFEQSEPLRQPSRRERQADSTRIREEMMEYELLKQGRSQLGRSGLTESNLEGFYQLAVLNPGRTGGFTGATVEAKLQMTANFGADGESAVDDRSHKIDSSARAIVFVAGLDIGGTTCRAEAAMNAVLERLIFHSVRQPRQVDPRGGIEERRIGLESARFDFGGDDRHRALRPCSRSSKSIES